MSDRQGALPPVEDWERQAAFMRKHGAVHAEWIEIQGRTVLVRLILGPVAPPPMPPKSGDGPARRLMQMHETQFAATRMKPPFRAPVDPDAAVPRAVRAKREAAADGAKKNSKRGS